MLCSGYVRRAHSKKLRMLALDSCHCRVTYKWEGGSCNFHPLKKCHAMGATLIWMGLLKSAGEPYHSATILKCKFHALAYEIECHERAKDATKMVSLELGKGHSNLPESTFSVY